MTAPTIDVEIPEAFGFLFDPPLGSMRHRSAYGGRGSAKSWQFARAILIHGTENPLRVLCGREFQSSIKDSVHRLLSDQIDMMGLTNAYTIERDLIFGSNGTELLFKGLRRDINAIKSLEAIDLCWIEEAQTLSKQSIGVLEPTIRKAGSEIWTTWNTGEVSDPIYQHLVANPPPRSIVKRVGYRDNPWLPDVLKESAALLKVRDPEAYAHVWGGEPWARSQAAILSDKCVTMDFDPREGWQGPYYGADWGFSQDPTILVRLWIADSRLYIEYDAGGIGLNNDQTYQKFLTVPGADKYTIRADNARPETINEMKRRGLRVEAAPKWSGSVEDGITHLRSYEQIVIHSRCKRAQEEARLYRYKVDQRTDEVLPDIVDDFNHVWDAVRYALSPFIRQRSGPRILSLG